MIYIKKVISQDIERTPTFNLEAIHDFFAIDIPHGLSVFKIIRLIPLNEEFEIEFKHRATRNEYRIFLKDLFHRIAPDIEDILIFTKINDDLFECEYIRRSDSRYPLILSQFSPNSNHQIIHSL